MSILERDISRKFKTLCNSRGWITIKLSVWGAHGVSGWPDWLVLGPGGRHCFIELKAPGKAQTDLQLRKMGELKALCHVCGCFDDAKLAVEAAATELG